MTDDAKQQVMLAHAAETMAAARNRLYAAKFQREGRPRLARTFTALALAEEFHAQRMLMHLRGRMQDGDAYLEALRAGKQKDAAAGFGRIAAALAAMGKHTMAEAFEQFAQVAGNHLGLIDGAAAEAAADPSNLYVCKVCGFIAADQPPDKCPVCGAVAKKFVAAQD